MIENCMERFANDMYTSLVGKPNDTKASLLRKQYDNPQMDGDFSFPISVQPWHEFGICDQVADRDNTTILQALHKMPEVIVKESKGWEMPLENVKIERNRMYLYLERPPAIRVGLVEALHNSPLIWARLQQETEMNVQLDPSCENETDVTSLRAKYVCNVIKNICAVRNIYPPTFVTCKSSSKRDDVDTIVCGTVLNAKTGRKETNVRGEDYIRLRQQEMALIAQHKYGVQVTGDTEWREAIDHMGESAVAFELLQLRPSHAVKIDFDTCAVGCSRGASFVLYNCARLETLIRAFDDSVAEGIYPELPRLDEVHFELLTHEEEWIMNFIFIMSLPSLLNLIMHEQDGTYLFRPNIVCSFLSHIARLFSIYYRRVRILVEPRRHLLPVMFARIHMLKILNDTIKICLHILNIKSVTHM